MGLNGAIDATLEAVIKRDRLVVAGILIVVVALAWAYLLAGAGMGMPALEMTRMAQAGSTEDVSSIGTAGARMLTPANWTLGYAVLMFFMWWLMMVAMMLPGAAPMILMFAMLNRKQIETGNPHVATGLFAVGYLTAWAGFGLVAVALQLGLERTGMLSPVLVSTNLIFSSSVLIAAGLYQLMPLKHACLRHCRSPLVFLGAHWRRGPVGAMRMGLVHGYFCVACCWFLMALLFFGGVMNLYWIIGLALFVLLEKLAPAGHWLGYATGTVLLAWGMSLLTNAP